VIPEVTSTLVPRSQQIVAFELERLLQLSPAPYGSAGVSRKVKSDGTVSSMNLFQDYLPSNTNVSSIEKRQNHSIVEVTCEGLISPV
jgi:hypothetical protein